MGKFAGLLKRAKKIAGFAGGVLNGLNKVYKTVKPFTEDIVGALPFGNYINKGLDIGSKVIDKIAPITKTWLNDKDKEKLKKINTNIKRYGGDVTQKVLNNYLDQQDEIFNRKGNYTLNDYASQTAGDIASGIVKRAGKPIFGQPLNKKLPYWVGDDKYLFAIKKGVKIYKSPTSWEAMDINGEKYDPSSGAYEDYELLF
jgi:hypothetical protein